MEKEKAIEIFNKRMDCKDAYQADPSCDGNCFSCEYYTSAEEEKEAMQTAISALEKQEQAENEWCPDCAEYDKERHCCHRFTKVIRQTVEECKREWANEGWLPPEMDEAAKRLNNLIFDINPAEICSQIESDNLKNWCKTIQTEMKMAMVQLPCWSGKE